MLSRRVGLEFLEAVEDAVQSSLMSALETWPKNGIPENPSAWLYIVAHNTLVGGLRKVSGRRRILEAQQAQEPYAFDGVPEVYVDAVVRDELLRMLFVCCDDSIPGETQLALALKTLCGFDTREIASRLFTSEASIYKRLNRARTVLRKHRVTFGDLSGIQYSRRLPGVHGILYLLFTEGHLSSHAEEAIRRELCDEAIRLTTLLADHSIGQTPETFALLALMHLHRARMSARTDASGGLLLLEEQDRTKWDPYDIETGLRLLAHSAVGTRYSRYHVEAGIAAEHCLASSFETTRWGRVVELYELLGKTSPSAIHRLNLALAVAECEGAAEGLKVIQGSEPPSWLSGSYLWAAVSADLHRRAGNVETAERYQAAAISSAPTSAVRKLMMRRFTKPAK